MKNIAFSFIEIIVSITLFSLTLFPIINYNKAILNNKREFDEIKKTYKNFQALEKQLIALPKSLLLNHLGEKIYPIKNNEIERDKLTKNILFPYPLIEKNNIIINITLLNFTSMSENFEYILLQISYINKHKTFQSKKLISRFNL